ncbi:capping enzyme/guanyltransferase [Taro reovirus 1]|nr:capping enzyme/guanyltransferase [Taro reovirus 1]
MERFLKKRVELKQKNEQWLSKTKLEKLKADLSLSVNAKSAGEVSVIASDLSQQKEIRVINGKDVSIDLRTSIERRSASSTPEIVDNASQIPEIDILRDAVNGIELPSTSSQTDKDEGSKYAEMLMYYDNSELAKYPDEALTIRIHGTEQCEQGVYDYMRCFGVTKLDMQLKIFNTLEENSYGISAQEMTKWFLAGEEFYLLGYSLGLNICILEEHNAVVTYIKVSPEPLTCVIRFNRVSDSEVRCDPVHASDAALTSIFKSAIRIYDGSRRIPFQLMSSYFEILIYDFKTNKLSSETIECPTWVTMATQYLNEANPQWYLICEGDCDDSRAYIDPDRRDGYLKKLDEVRNRKVTSWWEEVSTFQSEPEIIEFKISAEAKVLIPRVVSSFKHNSTTHGKLPTIGTNFESILINRGSHESEIMIGKKSGDGAETGLPLRYKAHVVNYHKKEFQQRCPNAKSGFLPGGLLHHTLGGSVVCLRIDVYNDMVIGNYGIFSGLELVRIISMFCEYSAINIPGRPYLIFDLENDRWLIPPMFKDYFQGRRDVNELTNKRKIITTNKIDDMVKQFNSYLRENRIVRGERIDRSYVHRVPGAQLKPRSRDGRTFYQSDLRLYPIDIHEHEEALSLSSPGEVNFGAAIGSIWPSMKRHYLETCDDTKGENSSTDVRKMKGSRSSNYLIPEAVDPALVIPSAASVICKDVPKSSHSGCIQLSGNGLILPCGARENRRSTSLSKHRCLLPYLGVNPINMPYGYEAMRACNNCGRLYGQDILAKLCEQVSCPSWPDMEQSLIVVT